jgi:transcriptional regulator with XRE-family HTH domain
MPSVKKPSRQLRRHFLKEWREFRGLTQEQAAARVDLDRTTLGRIENRRVPYSQGLLEAAAEAYDCEPWDLLNVDPTKEGAVIDLTALLKSATPEEQAEILGYARGRLKAS